MRNERLISRRGILSGLLAAPWMIGQEREPFTITDNVNLVLLDVSVLNKGGGYVTGLTKDDFQVYDSGRLALISHFANVDSPVTVGLVVDTSGSMRPNRPSVVMAGLAFARESNPQDEFFVVNFNDQVISGLGPGTPFTDDIQRLHEAMYMGDPAGKTALYDAIAYGLRHLEKGHRDKRTLIVVSDGGDNASKTSLKELFGLIEESRATIYTVAVLDPDGAELRPAILRRFSSVSGGEYFEPGKIEDVIGILRKISKDIRNRYTIGFTPEQAGNQKGLHSLKVTASRDGKKLITRTRASYTVGA